MNFRRLILAVVAFALALPALSQEPDVEGSRDHPLFSRMPGYRISVYEVRDFDTHAFQDAKQHPFNVEGRVFEIRYSIQNGAKEASRIQILTNYENAIKKIGGKVIVRNEDGSSFLTVQKDGKEIWAHIDGYITSEYTVWVVEKKGMEQDVVANAAVFADAIKTTGHVAVYGILFDTGKTEIKPESDAAIAEIAKLLKADASLKLLVVGHTDNVGSIESNMKLSQARAEAVSKVLTAKHGIVANRLKSYGVASLAPVATNDTEEGRAKNRRVELVKQ